MPLRAPGLRLPCRRKCPTLGRRVPSADKRRRPSESRGEVLGVEDLGELAVDVLVPLSERPGRVGHDVGVEAEVPCHARVRVLGDSCIVGVRLNGPCRAAADSGKLDAGAAKYQVLLAGYGDRLAWVDTTSRAELQ